MSLVAGVGAALVLPYYGAETFGLQAVAAQTLADGGTAMPAVTDAIRFGAVRCSRRCSWWAWWRWPWPACW